MPPQLRVLDITCHTHFAAYVNIRMRSNWGRKILLRETGNMGYWSLPLLLFAYYSPDNQPVGCAFGLYCYPANTRGCLHAYAAWSYSLPPLPEDIHRFTLNRFVATIFKNVVVTPHSLQIILFRLPITIIYSSWLCMRVRQTGYSWASCLPYFELVCTHGL